MHIHEELGLYCWVYYNNPDWVHWGSYIKLRTVSILVESHVMVRLYRTQFPESRCLFMYRDIISVAKSLYRVSMVEPSMRLTYILGKYCLASWRRWWSTQWASTVPSSPYVWRMAWRLVFFYQPWPLKLPWHASSWVRHQQMIERRLADWRD